MRPLIARRDTPPLTARRGPVAPPPAPPPVAEPVHRDPAPSIWSYRVQRLWLTPLFRRVLRVGVPSFALVFGTGLYFSDEGHRTAILDGLQEIRREIEARPEFRVNVLGIDGASDRLTAEIRGALALDLPVSSFDLDLEALRQRVEALPAVARADLRIQSGGYLAVRVTERVPALIWQTREGIVLIDREGHFVDALGDRQLEAPLPMVAGEGADRVVDEALALHAAAAPLGDRLRGFVRMGERRWDVVLTDDRRILLPERGAVQALDRALALQDATDILGRDVLRLDLRNPDRLTVQLTPAAIEELRRLRALERDTLTGGTSG
ncbi:cell division protein FtsQ/DivIB [Roseicyclus persicicus]|uniref:Cell division protein FtsQ n=1 Tax=Roseicyclus persicicus TaxID=2650661 RepID=A0A7X6GX00_9RHOB|nr:cell division protein FtsQ/DivIB [Roseibacterium persicicum]NKX43863.1 FtsQ-type POTRA domain-containing protein [Roseibacterium persicicum]